MERDGATKSIWQDLPPYISMHTTTEENYDVIIVGGGITGITTGLLLQTAGKKCLVAEAQNIGFGTTSGTTAHLNTILDLTYAEIEKNFGEESAKIVLSAAMEAINIAESNVRKYNIDCEFGERTGYLFSTDEKQTKKLDEAFIASKKAGCDVEYANTIPVPVDFQKALAFKRQAQIHPTKYLYGLASAFENAGGIILQQCRVMDVKKSKHKLLQVATSSGNLNAANVVYATHIPPGINLLHFRCAPYRSYAMALSLKSDYPPDLAYDLYDPYHYYRTQEINGKKYLIAGGEDHRTAEKKDTEECFRQLERYLREYFEIDEVVYNWSSQYFESTDGLPYIGHLPGNPDNVFVATGYGGNGITFSQIAARILTDLILEGKSKYQDVFDPMRIKPVAGFDKFIENAADVTANYLEKLLPLEKLNPAELKNGEAKLIKYVPRTPSEGNETIAVYKDENGQMHAVNPACTHIDCTVAWNTSEKVWECPCHGSRFSEDGQMFTAPARKDLQRIQIT
jgi:glycine/D-amino acid oxidase-like deaminating enzyme/nitrite reductase/ring-hydroxylating ferredoxin subunit